MALTKEQIKFAQRTINETTSSRLKTDGAVGPLSREAIGVYQKNNGLAITRQFDDATYAFMLPYIQRRFVTTQDIIDAANRDGLPPSMLLAFFEVESLGEGFQMDGRCVILFEGHKFYEYVSKRLGVKTAVEWSKKYPTLCYPKATTQFYKGGNGEWGRLEQARTLDATSALLGTSWGLFQLMGFNYAYGGFPDVQTMVEMHMQSEHHQLAAIVNFINKVQVNPQTAHRYKVDSLRQAVMTKNYEATAAIYNGPSFAKFDYHTKLRNAEQAWARKV